MASGDVKVYDVEHKGNDVEFQRSTSDLFTGTRSGEQVQPSEQPFARDLDSSYVPSGTILEAAFVDPAYSWPPKDGEGRNAIELQASLDLLMKDVNDAVETDSLVTTESMKQRMQMPQKPNFTKSTTIETIETTTKKKWWQCCRAGDDVVENAYSSKQRKEELRTYEQKKKSVERAIKEHQEMKQAKLRQKDKEHRRQTKYARVPEGILIYRLDTTSREVSLMNEPHAKTDVDALTREMQVVAVAPAPDKSRRGILVTGADGKETTLVACEQRTATAWLEAMSLMLAKDHEMGAAGMPGRSSGNNGSGVGSGMMGAGLVGAGLVGAAGMSGMFGTGEKGDGREEPQVARSIGAPGKVRTNVSLKGTIVFYPLTGLSSRLEVDGATKR